MYGPRTVNERMGRISGLLLLAWPEVLAWQSLPLSTAVKFTFFTLACWQRLSLSFQRLRCGFTFSVTIC